MASTSQKGMSFVESTLVFFMLGAIAFSSFLAVGKVVGAEGSREVFDKIANFVTGSESNTVGTGASESSISEALTGTGAISDSDKVYFSRLYQNFSFRLPTGWAAKEPINYKLSSDKNAVDTDVDLTHDPSGVKVRFSFRTIDPDASTFKPVCAPYTDINVLSGDLHRYKDNATMYYERGISQLDPAGFRQQLSTLGLASQGDLFTFCRRDRHVAVYDSILKTTGGSTNEFVQAGIEAIVVEGQPGSVQLNQVDAMILDMLQNQG